MIGSTGDDTPDFMGCPQEPIKAVRSGMQAGQILNLKNPILDVHLFIPFGSDTPKLASALVLEGRPPCRPWIATDRTDPVRPNASRLAPGFFTGILQKRKSFFPGRVARNGTAT